MKRTLLLLLTTGLAASGQPPATDTPPVQASLVAEVKSAAPGQPFRVAVKLVHAPDHHTYGKELPPEVIGKPTTLKWTVPAGWTVEDLPWPPTRKVPSTAGKTSEGYDGTVYLPAKITPAGAAGSAGEIAVKIDGLVCDPQSCLPFKAEAKLSIPFAAPAELDPAAAEAFARVEEHSSAKPSAVPAQMPENWLKLLLFAFLGGLILNVMPCVFPVLGIKIMGFVNQAGSDSRKVLLHGLAYTVGVLISFWALAALIILLRSQGMNVGWGVQLQSPLFVYSLLVFLFVFALNMAGVFEVGTSAVGVGQQLQAKSGLAGSFFSGLLATVVATPCAAPFLAPALGVALALPPLPSLGFFTVIGLGLAVPYLVLSAFPALVRMLPRPGPWMESFKQFMSFLLFGTVAYLLWTFEGFIKQHFDDDALLWVGLGLVIVAMACWIYGRWCPIHRKPATRAKGWIATAIALGAGLWIGWPGANPLKWEPWSPELVKKYHIEEKQPVYVDFTARWCATCQTNKRVYKSRAIRNLFDKHQVKLLKADWTNPDDRITEALRELKRAAIPVNALYIPGQAEPHILPNLLTVDNVTEALGKLERK